MLNKKYFQPDNLTPKTMPRHNKPAEELSEVQASKVQQDRVNMLNPQIELKQKALIARSREESPEQWIDTGNLPLKYKHMESRPNFRHIKRCALQIRPGRDMEAALIHFIDNAGVAHTGSTNYSDRARVSRKNRKHAVEEEQDIMMEEMV